MAYVNRSEAWLCRDCFADGDTFGDTSGDTFGDASHQHEVSHSPKTSAAQISPANASPETSPAQISPADTSPNTSPANASPAKTSLANASPANAFPANASPAKTSPANTSPANASLAKTSPPKKCPNCKGGHIVHHHELKRLTIAHLDCDAFYASVEKRDNPDLANKPVIVGGGKRGVVATACYVARIHGVRSAMPMFKALALCPDAVVISPRMHAYQQVAQEIRRMMDELTPLVEPLSIDEAYLDLTGTEALHNRYAAASMARLAKRIAGEVGISVSIGLSANKALAKLASDMDKPRGFHVIGTAEAILAPMPVTTLFGVGKALARKLNKTGIMCCADLAKTDLGILHTLAGNFAPRLQQLAKGIDPRPVVANRPTKSISAETTFDDDIADVAALLMVLDSLCDSVVRRLRSAGLNGKHVTLKLKSPQHKLITRSMTLPHPTRLKGKIFQAGEVLLKRECIAKTKQEIKYWRLLGIGVDGLSTSEEADAPDLADMADPQHGRMQRLQEAMDTIRDRHGEASIISGRQIGQNIGAGKNKTEGADD